MSQAGNGTGGNGSNGRPVNARRLDRRVVRPNYLPGRMNPEQGCYGCLISVGVVFLTFLVWVFIYWYNEPTFHRTDDEDAPPPPPAQTLRRRNPNP